MSELFEVRVEVTFDASHRCGPGGEPAELHGHRWLVAVHARSRRLDSIAIVVDFRRLRDEANTLLAEIAGSELEQHPELGNRPSTALAVGRWILSRLRETAEGEQWEIHAVEVECDPGLRYVVEAVDA